MNTNERTTGILLLSGLLLALLFNGGCVTNSTNGDPSNLAPENRPNFLIILADDMGFSDAGAYGGEITTPHIDQLAKNGLRYTRFYNTGRCWPTRTALLTGYYPQQVRMDPVRKKYDGIPTWANMLPDHFEPLGYRSYHSGKWHFHLENKPVADGHFDRSYRIKDHNRYFSPKQHFLDGKKLPPVDAQGDFYITEEIASRAISFLKQHEKQHEDQPWISYLAFTAPHFPLQAPRDDIKKFEGQYDVGWDVIRQRRLERMKNIGLVEKNLPLPPRQPQVVPSWNIWSEGLEEQFGPRTARKGSAWKQKSLTGVYGEGEIGRAVAWSRLSPEQKKFQAKKMEIHAAMIHRMDREIGRVLQQVRKMGDRKNTVVLFLSDNGASAELIVRGDGHDQSARMGSEDTYLCLGPGWSTAANTPYRLHKTWVHEGGITTPFIVNWPAGLPEDVQGTFRRTPGHVVDLLPTILELAGANPDRISDTGDGPRLPGRSLVPTFHQDVSIDRPYLYFQHSANYALRSDGWKLVKRNRQKQWQLYHIDSDSNELRDRSESMPDRVKRMKRRWYRLHGKFIRQSQSGEQNQ